MSIRPLSLDGDEDELWEELVDGSPDGNLFGKPEWWATVGVRPTILGYFRGGSMVAVLPVYETTRFGFSIASNAPYTPYAGLMFARLNGKEVSIESSKKEIRCEFARYLKEEYDAVSLALRPGIRDIQPYLWEGYRPKIMYTYVQDISDLGQVWRRMDASRRTDIRRAEKLGLTVEKHANFNALMALVRQTYQRQGRMATFPDSVIQEFQRLIDAGRGGVFLIKSKDDEAVAGVYVVWDDVRSYYLMGGYDHTTEYHGGTVLALWEAMRHIREERGLMEFDFEGSSIPGIEKFFRKFGGNLIPRYHISYAPPVVRMGNAIVGGVEQVLERLRMRTRG